MNSADPHLIQLLTGKPSPPGVIPNGLEEITAKFPYYALGQLLLAKKYKEEQNDQFDKQLQLCVAHFPNLTWVQSQLYNTSDSATFIALDSAAPALESAVTPTQHEAKKAVDNGIETGSNKLPAADALDGFTLNITDIQAEPELPPLDDEEIAEIDDTASETAAKIADVLQHQVEEFKTPVQDETPVPVSSEPFHTIDYFASQGIKIDAHAQDALTRKVHTFTDWLRQMKRINHYPTDLGSDPEMENYVQSIADTSNQPRAIDTEAMAEVLVKQGKLEKAIEVYEKLSLLNPGKTAYFAAKINYLKAS